MKICPNPECGYANEDIDLLCKECFELLDVSVSQSQGTTSNDTSKKAAGMVSEPDPISNLTPVQTKQDILGTIKLQIEQGLVVGKSYLIWDKEVTLGRSDEEAGWYPVIDLQEQEEMGKFCVSRKHAVLTVQDDKLFIRDLNSARGTRVNQKILSQGQEEEVKPGDRIVLGGTVTLRVLTNELL